MTFSPTIRPVCLPTGESQVKLGTYCIATGWGYLGKYMLRSLMKLKIAIATAGFHFKKS